MGKNNAHNEIILSALSKYGASLNDNGFIEKNGKVTGVKIAVKGKRIRYESGSGSLLATGPITEKSIEDFVEKFWFWKKNPARHTWRVWTEKGNKDTLLCSGSKAKCLTYYKRHGGERAGLHFGYYLDNPADNLTPKDLVAWLTASYYEEEKGVKDYIRLLERIKDVPEYSGVKRAVKKILKDEKRHLQILYRILGGK